MADDNVAAADVTFKYIVCQTCLLIFSTIRLPSSYPESTPEITVNKKKSIQSHQCADLQEKLCEKAKSLVGNEMIFDLVEYAKVSGRDQSMISELVCIHY